MRLPLTGHARRRGLGLRAWLLPLAALSAAGPVTAAADGFSPVFQLAISPQQLAVASDGRAVAVDVTHTPLPEQNAALRELRAVQIEAQSTNAGPVQIHASVAGPGSRFYYSNPAVALNASGGIVSFVEKVTVIAGDTDEYGVRWLPLDRAGHFVGQERLAGSPEAWSSDPVTRVAMNEAGQFAFVYFDQSYTIDHYARGQLFGADGKRIGEGFTLNTMKAGGYFAAWDPVVAIAPDGSSVYAWDDSFRDRYAFTPGQHIYLRRVNAAGQIEGGQVLVSGVANSSAPEIAIPSDGGCLVVWQGGAKVTEPRIYLRRYGKNGAALEAPSVVSPNRGMAPQVATTADGRFVVVWQGPVDSGEGLLAQRFNADGTPFRQPVVVTSSHGGFAPLVGMAGNGSYLVTWGPSARWISWEADGLPGILMQPAHLSRQPGDVAQFEVLAVGAAPLSYQWQHDGRDIPGATNAVLRLENLQPADGGSYRVIVLSPLGQSVSQAAVLGDLNDAFQDRSLIAGSVAVVRGSNYLAEPADKGWEDQPHDLNGQLTGLCGKSEWWSWTAPASGLVTMTFTWTTFSHGVLVFTGTEPDHVNAVGSMYASFGQNQLSFQAIQGTAYQIHVSSCDGNRGLIQFALSMDAPPRLTAALRPNGTVQLDAVVPLDRTATIEESPDLRQWVPLLESFKGTGEAFTLFDPGRGDWASRFFRVLAR